MSGDLPLPDRGTLGEKWANRALSAESDLQDAVGVIAEMLDDEQDGYRLAPDVESHARSVLTRYGTHKA